MKEIERQKMKEIERQKMKERETERESGYSCPNCPIKSQSDS